MARILRIGILLLVIALTGLWAAHPEQNIIMAPHVSKELNQVSTNYTVETMRYLHHFEFLGDIYIYDYKIGKMLYQYPQAVGWFSSKESLPYYHNHPPTNRWDPKIKKYYKKQTGFSLVSTEQFLTLSGTDIINALKQDAPFVIVGSDGKYAWWTQAQLEYAYDNKYPMLMTIKDQHTATTNKYSITLPTQ